MPKPIKNYCDYFSHDRDMRNHRKIKAIRTKFGLNGYAIWCMILEYLTGADGNVFEYSDVEIELMAGDFGVPSGDLKAVIDYCLSPLELLFQKEGFIRSESLDERLRPVYEKRGREKQKSGKQHRDGGKFAVDNAVTHGKTTADGTQKKVKEKKVKEKKLNSTHDSATDIPPEPTIAVVHKQSNSGVKRIGHPKNIEDPFNGDLTKWVDWKSYKRKEHRFSYKSSESENQALKNLHELSGGNISVAEKIIDQSIGNGWQGLFKLKNQQNGQYQKPKDTSGGFDSGNKDPNIYDKMK